ncbi:MAG: hypothetical protein P9M07_01620 [Candidatus Aceula meridiana]|nr:hypothetical protein [Candidatus Aceula meridiana]
MAKRLIKCPKYGSENESEVPKQRPFHIKTLYIIRFHPSLSALLKLL